MAFKFQFRFSIFELSVPNFQSQLTRASKCLVVSFEFPFSIFEFPFSSF